MRRHIIRLAEVNESFKETYVIGTHSTRQVAGQALRACTSARQIVHPTGTRPLVGSPINLYVNVPAGAWANSQHTSEARRSKSSFCTWTASGYPTSFRGISPSLLK